MFHSEIVALLTSQPITHDHLSLLIQSKKICSGVEGCKCNVVHLLINTKDANKAINLLVEPRNPVEKTKRKTSTRDNHGRTTTNNEQEKLGFKYTKDKG